jgi:hypothetical protein
MISSDPPMRNFVKALKAITDDLVVTLLLNPFFVLTKLILMAMISWAITFLIAPNFTKGPEYFMHPSDGEKVLFFISFIITDLFLVFFFFHGSIDFKDIHLNEENGTEKILNFAKHTIYSIACVVFFLQAVLLIFPISGILFIFSIAIIRLNNQLKVPLKTGYKLSKTLLLRNPLFYITYGFLISLALTTLIGLLVVWFSEELKRWDKLEIALLLILAISIIIRHLSLFLRFTFEGIVKRGFLQ